MVEFICVNKEDAWYYLEAEHNDLSWNTWPSYNVPFQNNIGLGWWIATDPQYPDFHLSKTITPVEEALSEGLHHIVTLQGSYLLTHKQSLHLLP